MKIDLLYDNTLSSFETIKFASLYFDEINIQCPHYKTVLTTGEKVFQDNISEKVSILLNSNIAKLDNRENTAGIQITGKSYPYSSLVELFRNIPNEEIIEDFFDILDTSFSEAVSMWVSNQLPIVGSGKEYFFEKLNNLCLVIDLLENEDNEFALNEYDDIFESESEKNDGAKIQHLYDMARLLSFLTSLDHSVYCSFLENKSIVISNQFIKHYIAESYGKIPAENRICVFEKTALSIMFPNFIDLNFEDILEIRYKLNDELIEMRYYIKQLTKDYSPDDVGEQAVKKILETKIESSIKQFESKLFSFRVGTIQKIIRDLKNPLSYAPLLTTFISNVPVSASLAASLGLVGFDVALEHIKQHKEVRTHPLYFSLKLNRRIEKIHRKNRKRKT